jgi:hypothetical protein
MTFGIVVEDRDNPDEAKRDAINICEDALQQLPLAVDIEETEATGVEENIE